MPSQSSVGPYASNQVTWSSLNSGAGLTYDAAGDVTYDGLNSYIYDAEGRICAVKNAVGSLTGYIYDAAGIRVVKGSLTSFSCNFAASGGNGFAVNTSWALGQDGEQVTEFSVNSGVSTWKHSNIYAGKLLGTYDTKGLHFYLDDWLGTRRIQTNALGQLELTCQSLPYGNGENCIATALSTAEDPTEQHFTGKERDAESGNDYFEARYYNSAAGRFLSPDWSAKEEPVPYAKLDDPQTLNLYAYVKNNPLLHFDPDGHIDCGCENAKGVGCQNILKWNAEHGISPDAKKSNAPGDIAVLPNGNKIADPNSRTGLMMSPTRDLSDVAGAGKKTKELVDKLKSEGKFIEAEAVLKVALGLAVGTGGLFDYQRMGPQSDVVGGGFQQLPQFRDVSNFNVGLFSQQAGMTLGQTLTTAGDFAHLFSGNFSPNSPYGLNVRTADFITGGYNAGASGAFNSH